MKISSLAVAVLLFLVALVNPGFTRVGSEPLSAKSTGYSIELIEAHPKPESILTPGAPVDIHVKVKYSMTDAQRGRVVMVLQDVSGGLVADASGKQPSSEVKGPSGSVSLSATIKVPRQGDALRVFVPLIPDGSANTDGEVYFSYKIAEGASNR